MQLGSPREVVLSSSACTFCREPPLQAALAPPSPAHTSPATSKRCVVLGLPALGAIAGNCDLCCAMCLLSNSFPAGYESPDVPALVALRLSGFQIHLCPGPKSTCCPRRLRCLGTACLSIPVPCLVALALALTGSILSGPQPFPGTCRSHGPGALGRKCTALPPGHCEQPSAAHRAAYGIAACHLSSCISYARPLRFLPPPRCRGYAPHLVHAFPGAFLRGTASRGVVGPFISKRTVPLCPSFL